MASDEAGPVLFTHGSASRLLTPLEAEDLLRRITFKICIEENPEGAWEWGTGFFISKDGYALTAFHNLPQSVKDAGCGTVDVSYKDVRYTLECLVSNSLPEPQGDIAVLQLPHPPSDLIEFLPIAYLDPSLPRHQRMQFWAGRPVCIFGFPFQPRGKGQETRLVDGLFDAGLPLVEVDEKSSAGWGPTIVSKTERLRFFGIRAEELEGISGAPLLDRQTGQIVGVQSSYAPGLCVVYGTEIARLLAPWPRLTKYAKPLPANRQPPAGRLTLVFTDMEDSVRMNKALGDQVYNTSIREPHNARIRGAIATHNGYEVKTSGDGFMIAFNQADNALACAIAIQRGLADSPIIATDDTGKVWTVNVRVGVHTADRELHADQRGDYHGLDIGFAARVKSLGVGGHIIASDATYMASSRKHYQWESWSNRRIKGFDQPEAVWELLWDGKSRGEPGSRWLPAWFVGEPNHYIPRPSLEDKVLKTFATPLSNGSTARVVTLHGAGGMGKTRLALACALQAVGHFSDGVFFVRLEHRPKSRAAVAEAIGTAFGMTGEATLPGNLLTALRDKEMLFILDNYESVDSPEVARYLAELLTYTRRVHMLVTGREALKLIDTEQLIDLNEGMKNEEARQLFLARARLKNASWQLDADEEDTFQRILVSTEGIPLAVELAAAWTDKRTLSEIAQDLEATPLGEVAHAPLRTLRTDTTERHRSLVRCLDWSFDLLEAPVQEDFARLGVFADTFPTEGVAAICDTPEAQELLDRLQDAALVRRVEVGGRSRYTMHRFTRTYAAKRLAALAAARPTLERFVAYYCQLVTDSGGLLHTLTCDKLAILDAEWRNAIAAAEVAERLRNWDSVVTLCNGLGPFLLLRGLWAEGERLGLQTLHASRNSGNHEAEGNVLNGLGMVYEAQGRWPEAEAHYQQSLAVCREIGNRAGEGNALNNLGIICRLRCQWPEAEAHYQQSIAIRREIGDRAGEGNTLNNLGNIYRLRCQWLAAEAYYQQSLALKRALRDYVGDGSVLKNLGSVYAAQGRWPEAETCYRYSLAICREVGDRVGEGRTLNNLGSVYERQGRWAEAEAYYQQSLALKRALGDYVGEERTLKNLSSVYERQGRWVEAEAYYQQSLAMNTTSTPTWI